MSTCILILIMSPFAYLVMKKLDRIQQQLDGLFEEEEEPLGDEGDSMSNYGNNGHSRTMWSKPR